MAQQMSAPPPDLTYPEHGLFSIVTGIRLRVVGITVSLVNQGQDVRFQGADGIDYAVPRERSESAAMEVLEYADGRA